MYLIMKNSIVTITSKTKKRERGMDKQKKPSKVFYRKIIFLKSFAKFTVKHLCQSLLFIKVLKLQAWAWASACSLIKEETLVQVFSCEFWAIAFKNSWLKQAQGTAESPLKKKKNNNNPAVWVWKILATQGSETNAFFKVGLNYVMITS